jgi:small redox-active disulfide protein 2
MMKTIQILGPGCAKCKKLAENTMVAIDELGAECRVEKIIDINEIIAKGVMSTPALVIDGDVKAVGKLLSVEQIKEIIG